MSAKRRLLQYLELKEVKNAFFYKTTGLSNGFLDKNDNINSDKIEIISSFYPDLNLHWLITGEGEMLRSDSLIYFPPKKEEPAPIYKSDPKDLEIIELQRRQIQLLESALAQSNLGLGSAHLAGSSTPPLMGIQSRKHK